MAAISVLEEVSRAINDYEYITKAISPLKIMKQLAIL